MPNTKTKKKIIMGTLIVLILLLTISTSQAAGTFTELQNNITNTSDDGTLDLTDDYNNTDNILIIINQSITINGQDHIIDFNNRSNWIVINNGFTVTLKNLKLTNGQNDGFGGAIYNIGNLTIINSNFIGNNASVAGAIFNKEANLTIINSNFTGNTATEAAAIVNEYGNLTINNSIFANNTAVRVSGAISNLGNLIIIDSTFTNNTADEFGGVMLNRGNITIISSTFTDNNASIGGVITNFDGDINIKDSNFTNNTAGIGAGVIYHIGNLRIFNSTFTGNTATEAGAIGNNGNLVINNSTFTNNNATNGGAILNTYNIIITNSTFTGNTATEAGAIKNTCNLNITTSTFTGNTAGDGGVIHNSHGNLSIIASSFNHNTGRDHGGVIYTSHGNLSIIASSFNYNQAKGGDNRGGVIYNNDTGNVTIINSVFTHNMVDTYSGGAIYNDNGTFIIMGSIFTNNTAGSSGGAIFNYDGCVFNISNTTFKENRANYGGVIRNRGNLSISQSVLVDNISNYTISNHEGNVTADANYWDNKNPNTNNLTNFNVNNYYVFLLKASLNTIYPNEVVKLELILVLNGTTDASWTGPRIKIGNIVFNSTGGNIEANRSRASFSAANVGTYIITATSQGITPQTAIINVVKASESSVITVSVPSSVVYGNYFTIKITLQSRGKLLAGQKIYVLYKGKVYKTGTTNPQGIATIKMPKLKTGTYTFTIQYKGNNNYQASNKITKKVKIVPLKITVTKPRNGQKRYSQTRTIIITFNQKIKKSTKYTRIYIKNLRTNRYTTLTKKIIGNKLYIKMKATRYKRNYYRIYIPRYAVVNMYGKTITKARTIKFRT